MKRLTFLVAVLVASITAAAAMAAPAPKTTAGVGYTVVDPDLQRHCRSTPSRATRTPAGRSGRHHRHRVQLRLSRPAHTFTRQT